MEGFEQAPGKIQCHQLREGQGHRKIGPIPLHELPPLLFPIPVFGHGKAHGLDVI
jgi:hypothetical protein